MVMKTIFVTLAKSLARIVWQVRYPYAAHPAARTAPLAHMRNVSAPLSAHSLAAREYRERHAGQSGSR